MAAVKPVLQALDQNDGGVVALIDCTVMTYLTAATGTLGPFASPMAAVTNLGSVTTWFRWDGTVAAKPTSQAGVQAGSFPLVGGQSCNLPVGTDGTISFKTDDGATTTTVHAMAYRTA